MLPIVIFTVILYGDRICQFVVSQKIPVTVIDIPAGSLYFFGFLNLKLIIIQIFLSLYNLQIEYPLDKDCGRDAENQDNADYPGLKNLCNAGFEPFPKTIQICSHSFVLLLPVSY